MLAICKDRLGQADLRMLDAEIDALLPMQWKNGMAHRGDAA